MVALVTSTGPPPSLRVGSLGPEANPQTGLVPPPSAVRNAYFAVAIDAAVDLLEAREYAGLPRANRLAKALGEQQGFLNGFFGPDLKVALDLRIMVAVRLGITAQGNGEPGMTSSTREAEVSR